jgi:hypothetical protein
MRSGVYGDLRVCCEVVDTGAELKEHLGAERMGRARCSKVTAGLSVEGKGEVKRH